LKGKEGERAKRDEIKEFERVEVVRGFLITIIGGFQNLSLEV